MRRSLVVRTVVAGANTLFQRFVSRRTPEFWLDCTKTCELNCPPNPPLSFSLVTSGMQRQHLLVYLAALDEPLATGLESQINFQPYPGFNMATSGYADFFATEVTSTGTGWRERRSIHVFCVVALSDFGLFDRRRYRCTRSIVLRQTRIGLGLYPTVGWPTTVA